MMTSLLELVTQIRQPFVELMLHVTFWAMFGLFLYICSRRLMRSSRELLLYFCLGILGLSLLILLPIKLWSPPASWQSSGQSEQLAWRVSKQTEVPVESVHNTEAATTVPAISVSNFNLSECITIAFVIIGLLVAFALARLLLGLISLECWRRSSEPINDPMLLEQFATLCQQMGITKRVSLRVTRHLGSPATIGWWRPTILLPSSWTLWNDNERQAVLAHELAHVRNRDYPLWLAVQLAAALHTYHPLVRMLVERLQGELELSADHLAAPYAGGTTNYMRTLCHLALRHGSRGAGHLSLALFPVQIPLSWRMMMLRSPTKTRQMPGIWSRLCLCGLLATLALGISGFRGATVADEKKSVTREAVASNPVSASPTDEQQVLLIRYLIVDMSPEEWKKLDFVAPTENGAGFKSKLHIEQVKEKLPKSRVNIIASPEFGCTFNQKSMITCLGIEEGGYQLESNVCASKDGSGICLTSSISSIIAEPTDADPRAIKELQKNSADLSMRFEECVCYQFPITAGKSKGMVRSVFATVTSQRLVQHYEIELRLLSVSKGLVEKFWKEDENKAEGKIVQHLPPRIYSVFKANELIKLAETDQRSKTLSAPRIITEEGQTGCITLGNSENDSLSINCTVKSHDGANHLMLSLEQTVIGPSTQTWLGTDNNTLRQAFSGEFKEDQFCCLGYQTQKQLVDKEDMMLVVMAKINKVKISTSPVK